MSVQPQRKPPTNTPVTAPESDAAAKAVAAWVNQFARTLKNCRLYDSGNAAVVRFRQQLAASLIDLLRERGSFTLRFTAEDVTYEGASLYPAKTRDDNFALPFYRDGIRAMTFADTTEPRDLDALIDALIRVTGPRTDDDDDLVTLLWEAQLRHIDVDYVPPEGDVGATAPDADEQVVPWPTSSAEAPQDHHERNLPAADPEEEGEPRSDDWSVGEPTGEFEASFAELQSSAAHEIGRFTKEFQAERERDAVSAGVAMSIAFRNSEPEGDDLAELARFVPRVLRGAVHEGRWDDACQMVSLLRDTNPAWAPVRFVQELQQPISVAGLRERLASQSEAEFKSFVAFALELGESAADVIGQVLSELHHAWQVALLCEAMVTLCKNNPERLGPWLADPRPSIVRAGVQVLGTIGGPGIVGPLQSLAKHPDARVRMEVLTALRGLKVSAARPVLLQYLESSDARLFSAALQKLSEARDPEVAQRMLLMMIEPDFEQRPTEEKHAIYSAIGLTGGDEVIPELEAELLKGGWFGRVNENHRQAVARCIARIGTPMARMVLEHAAQSKRGSVRDVCREMLERWGDQRG